MTIPTMRNLMALVEARTSSTNGNQILLDYFRIRPVDSDLVYGNGALTDAWSYYADSVLGDQEAAYGDLDQAGCRAFADWLEAEGHGRQMIYDDPQQAPAWMLMEPIAERLLPRTTWLAHFCVSAQKIKTEGFRYGVPDVARIALTREHSICGTTEHIRSSQPGYNFAYPTDGSMRLTSRWSPEGYGKQVLLFQSSGLLVHHSGDQERQVVFWGPSARLATARVIKATRYGFVADTGAKSRTIDELVMILKKTPMLT